METIMIDENSILATISPLMLLSCFLVMVIAAFISAKAYSFTNDFKKSVKLYFIICIGISVAFYLVSIPVILILAYVFCGFIFTALFSNYFFYH